MDKIKWLIYAPIQHLITRCCYTRILPPVQISCDQWNLERRERYFAEYNKHYVFSAFVKLFWWFGWRDFCEAESKSEAVGIFQERHGVTLIQVDFAYERDASLFGEEIDEDIAGENFWVP